jgi:serine/threonine-protein kinase
MAEDLSSTPSQNVTFLRQRDYQFVKELGQGACGRTVLLHDDLIDEYFVCKKYQPFAETHREQLFKNFVREIKLLHQLQHENVVRVFNYYLYPDKFTGYILMEFIDGLAIEDYVSQQPERTNSLFLQTVSGFRYLESRSILHRDIRPGNVLVRSDGAVKIIDLGFGKSVQTSADFDKSISLNWWCEIPAEFGESRYDFASEVYFLGKLFEKLVTDNEITHFKYSQALGRMCQRDPFKRTKSFADVEKEVLSDQFTEIGFSDAELKAYRAFADAIWSHLSKLESGVKYVDDVPRVIRQLENAYRSFMLEPDVPDPALVLRCLIDGTYYYKKNSRVPVDCVRRFLGLLKSCAEEKVRIVLANLHTRLDTLPRYSGEVPPNEDIPF